MIWWIVAWGLERAALKIGAFSYGRRFNGIGAIDDVVARHAKAPMAYRVLIPWIVGVLCDVFPRLRKYRLTVLYEPLKIAMVGAALWSISRVLGTERALLVAAMLPATFLYDYWDWAGELFGLAVALGGVLPAAWIGGLVAALSRPETAPLVPVAYWLVTRDTLGALIVAGGVAGTVLYIRLLVGTRPPYCQRWMIRQNVRDLRDVLRNRPVYLGEMSMSLLVTALALWVVLSGRAGAAWPVPVAILLAGWTMARGAETRVFASCLLWISYLV